MKKLKLDALDILVIEIADRSEHILLRFAGKPKNRVNNHGNTEASELLYRFFKTGKGVASADKSRRFLMDGLKAQLYSDGLDLIQGRKKIKYIVGQAVRPGADGKGYDTGCVMASVKIFRR